MDVRYAIETDLATAEFLDLLRRSGLAARRPVADQGRIARMVRNADLMVCARDPEGVLVGVSRCITDFAYCCFCSELAVDRDWRGRGIGRELMRLSHDAAGPETAFVLLSAPQAMSYYPAAGLVKLENCFGIQRVR